MLTLVPLLVTMATTFLWALTLYFNSPPNTFVHCCSYLIIYIATQQGIKTFLIPIVRDERLGPKETQCEVDCGPVVGRWASLTLSRVWAWAQEWTFPRSEKCWLPRSALYGEKQSVLTLGDSSCPTGFPITFPLNSSEPFFLKLWQPWGH